MFLITIYRLQLVSTVTFLEEFADLLGLYTVPNEDFIIAGDINIHVETESICSNRFNEMIDLYDLKQHIQESTHRRVIP